MAYADVLGLNRRELDFISPRNPRARILEIAANKVNAKALLQQHGLPVPTLYRVIADARGMADFERDLPDDFALKPSGGGRGCGILVTAGKSGGQWRSHGGRAITIEDLRFHLLAILRGDFSREGACDHIAFFEQKMVTSRDLTGEPAMGLPDVRVIVCDGTPVMAMARIPTRRSDGKANLHQGAVGVGIDIASGRTLSAVLEGERTRTHPDTGRELVGVIYPDWPAIRDVAVRAARISGLGYTGIDVVVDDRVGPAILEINARPGLDIQIANLRGLRDALRAAV